MHPARLAAGLARVVEGHGVVLHERTRALAIEPGRVRTDRGTVRAEVVVRATEGYTRSLEGQRADLVPVYSLIVATEPLPSDVWDEIGLRRRETFSDHRHVIVYGQRTADDRLVFGGRGAPYHFGSAIRPGFDRDERVFAALRRSLVELFPVLARRGSAIPGAAPSASRGTGARRSGSTGRRGWRGRAATSATASVPLTSPAAPCATWCSADDTELTRLPWVGHRSRRWEPEPLRWLGVNAGLRAMRLADARGAADPPTEPRGPGDEPAHGRSLRCSTPLSSWCSRPDCSCPAGPAPAVRPLPRVSVAAVSVAEGGTTRVVLTLDRPGEWPVEVRLDTRALTARGTLDYEAVHQVVEIPAGKTRVVVQVATLADGLDEADESFRVRITDPLHAVLDVDRATVEIRDADPVPGVAPQDAGVAEPVLGHRLGFTEVRLSAPSGRRVVVSLATRPGSAGLGDFVPLHPTVVFAPGETTQLSAWRCCPTTWSRGPKPSASS